MGKYYDFDHSIIDMAEDFYNAYLRCSEGKNGHIDEYGRYREECVFVPAVVNGSFAMELYLKSISENWGPSLKALFESLSDDDRAAIQKEVKTGNLYTYSFEDGLIIIDDAFEYWRYLHEKTDFGKGIRAINTVLKVLPACLEGIRKLAKNRWEENHKAEEQ